LVISAKLVGYSARFDDNSWKTKGTTGQNVRTRNEGYWLLTALCTLHFLLYYRKREKTCDLPGYFGKKRETEGGTGIGTGLFGHCVCGDRGDAEFEAHHQGEKAEDVPVHRNFNGHVGCHSFISHSLDEHWLYCGTHGI
jgi:hypothetical protein